MKLNLQAFAGLIIYPIVLSVLLVNYLSVNSFAGLELFYLLLGYYVSNITVGLGLHRLWSHGSYKTNKVVEFVLCMLSAGVLQGPVIAWASDHFKHHTYTDKELDPHTPKKYKSKIKGFLWSHIGWMLYKQYDNKMIDTVTMKKLGTNKLLIWQLKNYWKIVFFMHLVPTCVLGYLTCGTFAGAYTSFLFIGVGRALQQQFTFCVNSLCHFWGSRPYTDGTARNVWWLAIFLLGENWHNFHHAFPSDYRNGVKWYQCDVHKWLIYLMSKVGLAWDLEITSDVRINAKVVETAKKSLRSEWEVVNEMYESFRQTVYVKIEEMEQNRREIKNNIKHNLDELRAKIESVIEDIRVFIESPEISSKQLLKTSRQNFVKLQKSFDLILSAA